MSYLVFALLCAVAFLVVLVCVMAADRARVSRQIRDLHGAIEFLAEQVDPVCADFHALRAENAHLRAQLAETWPSPLHSDQFSGVAND